LPLVGGMMVYQHPSLLGLLSTDAITRRNMVKVARKLIDLGLNRNASGNIGVRQDESFLVTPSGLLAEEMTPFDIVEMDFSGEIKGKGKPSSEWRFHRDILAARSEIGAVIHTHSQYATSLSCLNREIPAFHYMIAVAGGDNIRCAPYAVFGSQSLSNLALQALENRKACLLGNHGLIAIGKDLSEALAIAIEVESLCKQYWITLQVGEPNILTNIQMHDVIEKFKDYSQWAKD
jgi:L-fuculose-phosphate aldolase